MSLTRRECLELELEARKAGGRPPSPSLLDEIMAARLTQGVLLKRALTLVNHGQFGVEPAPRWVPYRFLALAGGMLLYLGYLWLWR